MFRHIGIVTRNPVESVFFYRQFGFQHLISKEEHQGFIDRISKLNKSNLTTYRLVNKDGDMIELLHYGKDITDNKPTCLTDVGLAHIALTIESFDKLLVDNNLICEPTVDPEGKAKVAFCISPEGVLIELVEIIERNDDDRCRNWN